MGKVRVLFVVILTALSLALSSCGGQGHSGLQLSASPTAADRGAPMQTEKGDLAPATPSCTSGAR